MTCYSREPRTRKYVKGYGFLSFAGNLPNIYGKNYWIMIQKQEWMLWKLLPKKVVHKTAEVTEEMIGNKIAEKIMKPKPAPDENFLNIREI